MNSLGASKRKKRPSQIKCSDHRWQVLSESECVDCGESNPILLDFDHIDPKLKVDKISNLVGKGNFEKLVAEIDKCEIRCASCHRLKSAMEAEYYRDILDWNDPEIVKKYMRPFLSIPRNVL